MATPLSEQTQVPAADTEEQKQAKMKAESEAAKQTKKKLDDPKDTIQQFLNIVDDLHKRVGDKSQKTGGLTTAQSATAAEIRTGKDVGKDEFPTPAVGRQTSLPVLDSKAESKEDLQTSKLQRNLRLLREDVVKLQDLRLEVAEEVFKHIRPLEGLLNKVIKEEGKSTKIPLTKGMKKDLDVINKKIFNLMCQVPLLPNKRKKGKGEDSDEDEKENDGKGIVCLPGIHASEKDLKKLAAFRYVLREFEDLTEDYKFYLLSFAVFPENQEVNRTMLMYWWIGEGILSYKFGTEPGAKKPEDVVKEILMDFTKRNLIEPVENKHKVEPNSYKMTPFVHASLVLISQEVKLFNMYRKGSKPTMKKSELYKVCLVEDSSGQPEAKAKKMPAADIETIFNVSERFPDFTFKWFPEEHPSRHKMLGPLSTTTYKMLKVFYLGRWERTAKRHIEVENPELMKNLKHMIKLRLLSFQGISRIERLDDAVCKLQELIILDLRACYNLEKLPEKIDSLKELIYLDITDCYMIDRMPKRLSWLDNLEVLKGFVVSDATDEETVCTLVELKHLKKLRKLSITINKEDFGVDNLIEAIEDFKVLEKLKVAWGGINKTTDNKDGEKKPDKKGKAVEEVKKTEKKGKAVEEVKKPDKKGKGVARRKEQDKKDNGLDGGKEETKDEENAAAAAGTTKKAGFLQRAATMATKILGGETEIPSEKPKLPTTLRKLDLQCFPDQELPEWLEPKNLLYLEKLYIKGGKKLTRFGKVLPEQHTDCKVKILRLKFLPKLKVEWRELSQLYFPNLTFLEKYQCPQVSLCPCDGIGIWRQPKEDEVKVIQI